MLVINGVEVRMGPVVARVEVRRELFEWARERARLSRDDLSNRFPRLEEWERGERAPTLKQLEDYARATHTPVGFLLLPEPPREEVPIPDYRTFASVAVSQPSADLLDTIYQCQQRQEWYRDFARTNRDEPLSFVGSVELGRDTDRAATAMRDIFSFEVDARGPSWSEALRRLIDNAESLGVLVMVSGVVGSNTHRTLDPDEFRGFALVDPLAPLVFINGADTKAAQIFTLAHELAHVLLGESGVSDVDPLGAGGDIERWCNDVAAEFLAPIRVVREEHHADADLTEELDRIARVLKVSTLVVLRRIHEAGLLAEDAYRAAYRAEHARVIELRGEAGEGGNFYNTQPVRVSKRFARAIIASTLGGQTLHRDALQLLGFKKVTTFHELARHLGVM